MAFIDNCQQSYGLPSVVNGLSHGLKIARQLSIFAPVCGLVPPFQVLVPLPEKGSMSIVGVESKKNNFQIVSELLLRHDFMYYKTEFSF